MVRNELPMDDKQLKSSVLFIFPNLPERGCYTGKSLSEALLFAEQGENMLCTEIFQDVKNNFCTQHVLPMF